MNVLNYKSVWSLCLLMLGGVFLTPGFGQTLIWQESFEASQDFEYVVTNRFYKNTENYFSEVTVEQIVADYNPYEANTGIKFFAASNTDDQAGGKTKEKTILFESIDTAGKGDLTFYGDFASSSDPSKDRFEKNDGAVLFYSTDGGNEWSSSLSFVSKLDDKKGKKGHLAYQDPNFIGLDTSSTEDRKTIESIGAGTGASLTNSFTEFSFLIPEADSVIFKILVSFDGKDEEFAFDNFRLVGAIPEPSTYALIFGAGALLVVWLRKRK